MLPEGPESPADARFDVTYSETLVKRIEAPRPCFPLMERMIVERGGKDDWNLLKDLHYKENNLPIGPRFYKLTLDGETIGVLVTSNPKGLLKERHVVFPNIKPGSGETVLTNTARYVYINANFRVISRFVVDTMYRGIGAGYRMMNLVSRMEGNTYMEIQSSMSKFNHFGQKAGFRFVRPMNANKFDTGMMFFRQRFAANPADFEAVIAEIEALEPYAREKLIAECRLWYYRNSPQEKTGQNHQSGRGMERVNEMSIRGLMKSLQQITMTSPMYGVWKNPDKGRAIPQTLPLLSFENQGPTAPFDLGAL